MGNKRIFSLLIAALLCFVCAGEAWGQQYPERRHIRRGNRLYDKEQAAEASAAYREALQRDSLSLEGAFNLGDAQYALGDFVAAENTFKGLLERESIQMSDSQRSQVHYNLGNSQFQQQKLQEALESYKSAIRLNPDDREAKFNYLLTKQMLEQNQNEDQNEDQNQDQNQDQNNEGDGEQQPQEGDGEQQPQEGDDDQEQPQGAPDDQPSPEGEEPQREPQPQNREMSTQLLDAVQHAEDQTRERVDSERKVGVGASGKNW